MERTNKKERKENAKAFWFYLKNSSYTREAAIVIESQDSKTNPHIHRVQFITNRSNLPFGKRVIAESVDGVAGCFRELIRNIHGDIKQVNYFEDNFEEWLKKECRMEIIFNDGLVIMIKG